MARTWGAFLMAKNTTATYRLASTGLTARVDPNRTGARPGRKTLTVQAGQTYSYTAAWSGENLVLVKNQ